MIWHYWNPQVFDTFEPLDLKKDESVILYGAGRIGGVAAHCLKKRGIRISAFCDSAEDKHETTFCGIRVISPAELKQNYANVKIIISSVFHESIRNSLIRMGFEKIYDCAPLFSEIDFANFNFWMTHDYAIRMVEQYLASLFAQKQNDDTIDALYLNVTTKCTLRCKECSSFVPYIANHKNYTASEIMGWLASALHALGSVRVINFYGGEPFLHPQLADMLVMMENESRAKQIQVTTNATILPNDRLLAAMKKIKIHVRLSKYAANVGQKTEKLIKLLEDNGIVYEVVNFTYWDAGSKIQRCDLSVNEIRQRFKDCTSCRIMYLLDGKSFLCSPSCYYYAVDNTSIVNRDYANLNGDSESIRSSIKSLKSRLQNGDYIALCKYCTGTHATHFERKVPVAEQASGLLTFPELH